MKWNITVAEQIARLVVWEVEASSSEEAEEAFGRGERTLLSQKDVDVIESDTIKIEKVKPRAKRP